ncbi:hypothetical protein VTL71DRAFT_6764 [Oculimacula yallundae]|uniref:Uncharacterized protein n=1 Tax=Oculimacula yallundae TaxID=86028 RepID=A0ABR4C0H0_9HELO
MESSAPCKLFQILAYHFLDATRPKASRPQQARPGTHPWVRPKKKKVKLFANPRNQTNKRKLVPSQTSTPTESRIFTRHFDVTLSSSDPGKVLCRTSDGRKHGTSTSSYRNLQKQATLVRNENSDSEIRIHRRLLRVFLYSIACVHTIDTAAHLVQFALHYCISPRLHRLEYCRFQEIISEKSLRISNREFKIRVIVSSAEPGNHLSGAILEIPRSSNTHAATLDLDSYKEPARYFWEGSSIPAEAFVAVLEEALVAFSSSEDTFEATPNKYICILGSPRPFSSVRIPSFRTRSIREVTQTSVEKQALPCGRTKLTYCLIYKSPSRNLETICTKARRFTNRTAISKDAINASSSRIPIHRFTSRNLRPHLSRIRNPRFISETQLLRYQIVVAVNSLATFTCSKLRLPVEADPNIHIESIPSKYRDVPSTDLQRGARCARAE